MKTSHRLPALAVLLILCVLAGCASPPADEPPPTDTPTDAAAPSPTPEPHTAAPDIPTEAPPPAEAATFAPALTSTPGGPTTTPQETDIQMQGWTPHELILTFISNSGFMVESGDIKVVVDAFFVGFNRRTVPVETTDLMAQALPPYDGVDVILVTHEHGDHFDADIVADHMVNNPGAVLVTTETVARQVRQRVPDLPHIDERITGLTLRTGDHESLTANGVPVNAYYISHGSGMPNTGYVFTVGQYTLLHTGDMADTNPIGSLLAYDLTEMGIDFAMVPWFFLADPDLHDFVTVAMAPRYALPMHYDYTIDQPDSIRERVAEAFPEAIILYEEQPRLVLAPEG